MLQRPVLMIGSSVAAVALAVCSSLAFSTALAADFPTGSYEAKGIVITFATAQKWHLTQGKDTVVSGTYSVKGDQLEITDVDGPWACKAGQQTGTYAWKVDNAVLTFTKVADACKDRSDPLTTMKFKRQS
jgi:hypothetical protein